MLWAKAHTSVEKLHEYPDRCIGRLERRFDGHETVFGQKRAPVINADQVNKDGKMALHYAAIWSKRIIMQYSSTLSRTERRCISTRTTTTTSPFIYVS